MANPNWKSLLPRALLIVAAGFWVFSPAFHGDWLMDDANYITGNPLLRDAAGLWKIWFEPESFIEYYPLNASVEWIEWNLFGDDPFGYHLLNIVLHVVNALLIWRLLAKFGLRLAWLGGLIFAIHPRHGRIGRLGFGIEEHALPRAVFSWRCVFGSTTTSAGGHATISWRSASFSSRCSARFRWRFSLSCSSSTPGGNGAGSARAT